MDEKKREEIRVGAKRILDNFNSSINSVKFSEKKGKKEVGGFRKQGEGMDGNKEFRERLFANAPHKDGDFIIAETKKW
jgi:hypothetical protein